LSCWGRDWPSLPPGFQPGREVPDDHCRPICCARYDPACLHRCRAGRPRRVPGRVPPGSALDNSVIESRHSTLVFELRSREHFATKTAGRGRCTAAPGRGWSGSSSSSPGEPILISRNLLLVFNCRCRVSAGTGICRPRRPGGTGGSISARPSAFPELDRSSPVPKGPGLSDHVIELRVRNLYAYVWSWNITFPLVN
jgi:hypothetical protein